MHCSSINEIFQCSHGENRQESQFFTKEQLSRLQKPLIPNHIAIIPDGNRRWAMKRNSSNEEGHKQGVDIVINTVKAAKEIGIRAITFYAFSTENWNRPPEEVAALMWLIEAFLEEQKDRMIDEGIRLHTIGDESKLPLSLRKTIAETKEATAHCSEIALILAINYGGRDEIVRAFRQIADKVESGQMNCEEISEEAISRHLDTSKWKDPELMIRTSGEMRISNFLIWQLSYSEIYVADVFWPDFKPQHLYDAIVEYQVRERRLGN